MEGESLANISHCYGCLCKSEKYYLSLCYLQNNTLKSIFQMTKICLCYLCKKRLQQIEQFIQNVQNNQIYLKNIAYLDSKSTEIKHDQVCSLSYVTLETIGLGFDDQRGNEDEVNIVDNVDSTIDKKDIKLEPDEETNKVFNDIDAGNETELKRESNELPGRSDPLHESFASCGFEDNSTEEYDNDDYTAIKEIKRTHFKNKQKLIKKKNSKKKRNAKKEVNVDVKEEDISETKKQSDKSLKRFKEIETIYLTKQQSLEERANRATEKIYVDAIFKCESCIRGFNFKPSYEKHLAMHGGNSGSYRCDICKIHMTTLDKLRAHRRNHLLRYKCSECPRICSKRVALKNHYTVAHGQRHLFTCDECSKGFRRLETLKKHIDFVHKNMQRMECEYCKRTYSSQSGLRSHMFLKHPSEMSTHKLLRQFVCQECDQGFLTSSQLLIHKETHSERRDYYCVECDKNFKSSYTLKNHLEMAIAHSKRLKLPHACQYCSKRFTMKRDLERHTNRVHLNVKPYKCDQCDKEYICSSYLKVHKRLIHEGYKRPLKYPCTVCDKVFDVKSVLTGHMRTHTGERPYKCSKCPAQFSQAGILGTHVKLIHLQLTRDGRPKAISNLMK